MTNEYKQLPNSVSGYANEIVTAIRIEHDDLMRSIITSDIVVLMSIQDIHIKDGITKLDIKLSKKHDDYLLSIRHYGGDPSSILVPIDTFMRVVADRLESSYHDHIRISKSDGMWVIKKKQIVYGV